MVETNILFKFLSFHVRGEFRNSTANITLKRSPESPVNRKRTKFALKLYLVIFFLKFPIYLKMYFQNLKNSQFFINFKKNQKLHFSKIFFFGWIFFDYFFPVRIFWGCRVDAEIGPLSIYRVCRAILALLHPVWSQFMHLGGCSRNIWGSYGLRKFLVYTKCYLLPKRSRIQ